MFTPGDILLERKTNTRWQVQPSSDLVGIDSGLIMTKEKMQSGVFTIIGRNSGEEK